MAVSEQEIDEQQVAAEPITDALSKDAEQDPRLIGEVVTIQQQLEPLESDDTQIVQAACMPIVMSISTDALYCGDTEPMAIVRVPHVPSSKSLILHRSQRMDTPYSSRSRQEIAHMAALHIVHEQEAQFHHNILAVVFFAALILCVVLFAMQHAVVR